MEAQLLALYEERKRLARELGTADADRLIAMVRSLEAQLVALYSDKLGSSAPPSDAEPSSATASEPPGRPPGDRDEEF